MKIQLEFQQQCLKHIKHIYSQVMLLINLKNNMNEEIIKKIITISEIKAIKKHDEESGLDVILGMSIFENVDGHDIKYAIWNTKKDGTATKAITQYKSQGVNIGSQIGIAYKEQPNNFEYKDKKTGTTRVANSTNRTIMWFSEPDNIEEFANSMRTKTVKTLNIPPADFEEVLTNNEDDKFDLKNCPF